MAKASAQETERLFRWLQKQEENGVNVPAWERTVFGYTVLVDNCCDPDLNYLEWRPEYKKAIDAVQTNPSSTPSDKSDVPSQKPL